MEIPIFRADKILSHIDRVKDWLDGKNPPPITLELDLTNRCNNHCPACIGFRQPLADLKNPEKIIRQIAKFGIRGLIFTGGGEPLLHKDFVSCVILAKSLGMDVAVISNGLAMTKKIAQSIKTHCTWIRISLDSDNPKLHEKIHGVKGVFGTVLQNISSLVQAKGEATIGTGFLTRKETLKGMLPATKLCKKLGVDYIQFRPFHFDLTNIDKELGKCQKLATKKFKVLFSKHKYDCMKKKGSRDYTECFGQQFASVIAATGKMYICCHLRANPKYYLGDIYKQSLKEIWNSKQRQVAIKNIENFKDCIPFCRCHTFNRILFNIKQKKEHVNFL